MEDSQKEKSEIVEKHSEVETVTPKDSKDKSQKNFMDHIVSEEKVERLHEAAFSKISVEPAKMEKTEKCEENQKEENLPEEGKIVPKEENPVPKEEKHVPKEGIKDLRPEEPIRNDEKKLEEENKIETAQEKQRVVNSVASCGKQNREKIIRNQSDIFSLKEIPTTLQTSIFSVNGCPSRKLFRKQEPAGHIFQRTVEPPADKIATSKGLRITKENYNDEKRPSSSYRNPLTGSGLSSNDEYKSTSKGVKRKDGNPLLGLGYDTEVVSSVASQHRIPPGGFSHKLW